MADNTLQDIKDRLDIVEVITSYIPTKKSGTNYKATCPFHNEKTASLMISPQKQIWHCFGCGEGGDVFGFVMRYENLEFREALQQLATRAGVALPDRNFVSREEKKQTDDLIRINNFTAKFYHAQLGSDAGKPAREYLLSRGLNDQTIKKWELGFAPESFDVLCKALQSKKVTSQSALAAGVVARNDRGNVFDRFRNRIVFPIRNFYGDVVGFTARVMPGSENGKDGQPQAKYINSPETEVYNKSKLLFGLNAAKAAIRKADEAVIVEGQMDCIMAHQAGFENTVATSGTAMTEDHLRLVGRLTKNLKLCFDADLAGLQALRRAGEIAMAMGFRIKVIVLKDAKDPGELIPKAPGEWRKAVAAADWFIDYYLDLAEKTHPFGSLEQKQYLTSEIMPLLAFLTNPLEQGHYIRLISERFAVTENELRAVLKPMSSSAQGNSVSARPTASTSNRRDPLPKPVMVTPESVEEKEILGGMMMYPEFRAFVLEEGLPSEYISIPMRTILNATLIGEPLSETENTPANQSLANEAQFMVESSLENLNGNELALMRELKKSFYLFKKAGINKQLQDTTTAIKKAESLHDTEAVKEQTQVFAQLSSERYALEQKLES